MEEVTIIDGLVPKSLAKSIAVEFKNGQWTYGRKSLLQEEEKSAWGMSIAFDYQVVRPDYYRVSMMLFSLIEDELRQRELLNDGYRMFRIGADGRTDGQYGYVHYDHTESNMVSVLYYINDKWKPEWQGPTLFFNWGTELSELVREEDVARAARVSDFTPGRFVIFPSALPHSSMPPTNSCDDLRMTLSFVFENVRK